LREIASDLATISFWLPPTSPDERSSGGGGFYRIVYAVLAHRRYGARHQLAATPRRWVRRLRKYTKLPLRFGFGVSTAAHSPRWASLRGGVWAARSVETSERNRGTEAAAWENLWGSCQQSALSFRETTDVSSSPWAEKVEDYSVDWVF